MIEAEFGFPKQSLHHGPGVLLMVRVCKGSQIGCFLLFLIADVVTTRAAEMVTVEPKSEGLVVSIDGAEFIVLRHGSELPKPYFWPVRAADGTILTRPIDPNEKEHPHHRGIWLAVDEVNDVKFWAERGKIMTREIKSDSGNPATVRITNDWVRSDGQLMMIERTTISIFANRLMTYDITLAPPAGQLVRFDDTKEGFLGIRIAESMREKVGGIVVNSEGKKGTTECWGRPARWVDYTGNIDGRWYGVTLMDHPDNFRPSRYHVRDYGLFSLSPFGEGAYQNEKDKSNPVILDSDRPSLRIRYGLYVHPGLATDAKLEEAYQQFVRTTTEIKQR